MSPSIAVRLSSQTNPRAHAEEKVLLLPLSLGNRDVDFPLPPISAQGQQKLLGRVRDILAGLASANTNQDWWYLPVSEVQPVMSELLPALELEGRIAELVRLVGHGKFVLSVSSGLLARYLMETDMGCTITARPADRVVWALDRCKNYFRRYVNAAFWAIEHVRHVVVSAHCAAVPKKIKTLFITRFEADLENPDGALYRRPWHDRYLGEMVEDGLHDASVMIVGRCGADPKKLAKFTSGYGRFPMRTLYQALRLRDVATALLRALYLRLRPAKDTPISRLIVAESRNHVRALADCLLVERALTHVLRRCTVEQIVCMQENSVWEHAIVRAARKRAPQARLIGYFHCPVMASAMRYHCWSEVRGRPMFDAIVPLGEAMARALCRLGPWERYLWPGFGFRNPDIGQCLDHAPHSPGETFRIVVLLGGMFDNGTFLGWINHARKGLPEHRLLIKGHPVYGSEEAIEGAGMDLSQEADVEDISSYKMIDALKVADCVLYKGTTAGISALAAGVPTIHIDHGALQSDDTLFDSGGLSTSVGTVADFQAALQRIMKMESPKRQEWAKRAKEYAARYYELSPRRRDRVLGLIFGDTSIMQSTKAGDCL